MFPIGKRSLGERNPDTGAAGGSFPGEESQQKFARVSDGTPRRRGGSGSDPSRATPGIGPVAASAGGVLDRSSGDADAEVGAARVTVSKAAREGSSSVVYGIGRSVQVLSEAVTPRALVPVEMASARRPAPMGRWMNGLRIGDMVWGKVKTHPWWPGYIFNTAFTTSDVRRTRKAGHVLVAFFGDNSYGWFFPSELIPFGPHFLEKKQQQTTSKIFVKAVEESQDELRRRVALGMSCRCRNPRNFRDIGFPAYVRVDVPGYEQGAEYSWRQIESARDSFQPKEFVSFLQQLAVAPRSEEPRGVDFISGVARVLAYRKAVAEDYDETYPLAHGVQPVRPSPDDHEESEDDGPYCFAPGGIH